MQIIQRKKFVINAKCCFKNSQQFFAQSYQCDRILFHFNSGHAEQTNAVIFCTTIHSVFRTWIAYLYCSLFLQGEEIKKWTSNSGNWQTLFLQGEEIKKKLQIPVTRKRVFLSPLLQKLLLRTRKEYFQNIS